MAPDTYREILARNIRAARSRIGIGQEDVAVRMRALGYQAWIRQTVGATERGRRRPTAEEILGLAACLGTTVQYLMSPLLQDGPVELPSGMPLATGQVRSLIFGHGPNDEMPRGSSVRDVRDLRGIRWQGNAAVLADAEHPATRPISVEETLEQQPVATAIVTADGRVLVGRRNDGKPPWTFISGEVEPGESPADAARREVKEETTLDVETGEVIGERVHPRTGRTMIYLAAQPTHGTEIFVGDEDELAEVRWVSLAEADELMAEYGMFEPVREYLARELGEG